MTRPLADGGPGFLEVLGAALGGRAVPVPTLDPLGRPVDGRCSSWAPPRTWKARRPAGCTCWTGAERDPKVTTSYGLGVLVTAAVESGVREIVVGLGGSATNDAGAGMLAALAAAPLGGRRRLRPAVRRSGAGALRAARRRARGCAMFASSPRPTWTTR